MMEETLQFRKVLIMQDVYDQRCTTRLDGEALDEPGGALLCAMTLDRTLPPRLRLAKSEWVFVPWKYERLTKRELQKRLYRSWRKLRRNIPRGFVFSNMRDAKRKLGFVYDFAPGADHRQSRSERVGRW
jgi:hypothetical protein